MIQPSEEFRYTRRERFEAFLVKEGLARNHPGTDQLDENSAWVAWQAAEALCCNAFYDAGAVLIPAPKTRFDVDKIKQAMRTGNGHFKCVVTEEESKEFKDAYLYILFDYHRHERPKRLLEGNLKGHYLYVDGDCGFRTYSDDNTFINYSKSYRLIDIKSLYKTDNH